MDIVLGIILLVAAVFLVVAVLLQNGKSHNSGAITGGAETFFGKTKGSSLDKMLNKITTIVAIAFCLIVAIMYIAQEDTDWNTLINTTDTSASTSDTTEGDDTADVAGDAEGEASGEGDAAAE